MPSILTAAGTTVAFATIYAAYALYGFLGPASAFVLLGIVALATLAAALLHGPALAALGQVGAFVAPLLVATAQPNYWALYLYLAVVTAASFALARARLWRWLAITAVVFGVLWAFPGIADDRFAPTPVALYLVIGFALAAALLVSGLLYGPDAEDGRIDPVSSGALAAYLFAAAVLVLARDHDGARADRVLRPRRRDGRDRVAHRCGRRRRAGRGRARRAGDRRLGGRHPVAHAGRPGRPRGRARSHRASSTARISRSAARSRRCSPAPASWRKAARRAPKRRSSGPRPP